MRKPRVYLDTSVINFVFAEDAPDFRQATRDFFENYSLRYDLYISEVALLEISHDPDEEHRRLLDSVIAEHPISQLPVEEVEQVEQLASRYMQKGVVPESKKEDALHVAYATVFEMDFLLTWNFKHMANVNKEARFLAVNIEEGYRYPLRIVSPLEVLDEEY